MGFVEMGERSWGGDACVLEMQDSRIVCVTGKGAADWTKVVVCEASELCMRFRGDFQSNG